MNKTVFKAPPGAKAPSTPSPMSPAALAFVDGADADKSVPATVPKLPKAAATDWLAIDDKARVGGAFNVRPTSLEKACLEFIAKKTPYSMHAFIIAALRPALADKMKELTGEDIPSLRQVDED